MYGNKASIGAVVHCTVESCTVVYCNETTSELALVILKNVVLINFVSNYSLVECIRLMQAGPPVPNCTATRLPSAP